MNCTDFRPDAYADGQLTGRLLAEHQTHLSSCAACHSMVESIEHLDATLRQHAPSLVINRSLTHEIHARIAEAKAQRPRVSWWARQIPVAATAVVAMALFLGFQAGAQLAARIVVDDPLPSETLNDLNVDLSVDPGIVGELSVVGAADEQ